MYLTALEHIRALSPEEEATTARPLREALDAMRANLERGRDQQDFEDLTEQGPVDPEEMEQAAPAPADERSQVCVPAPGTDSHCERSRYRARGDDATQ